MFIVENHYCPASLLHLFTYILSVHYGLYLAWFLNCPSYTSVTCLSTSLISLEFHLQDSPLSI